jgi:hypothetical protein
MGWLVSGLGAQAYRAAAAPATPQLALTMPGAAPAPSLTPPADASTNPLAVLLAQQSAQQPAASTVLYLENLISCKDLVEEEERSDLADDVKLECSKRGEV